MKKLNMNGLTEISLLEAKEVNGGNWWRVISIIIAAANDAVNNPDDVKAGYEATYRPNAGDGYY